MSKRALKILGILLCAALVGFGAFYFIVIAPGNKVLNEVRNAKIMDIDLSKVADGSYVGEFSYSRTTCKVEVVVAGHRIETINIMENGSTDYAKKAEAVTEKVIAEQKTNVDVVSGATTTSKALLKAVVAALEKGLQ